MPPERLMHLVRDHRVFVILLAGGGVMRGMVQSAYQPALLVIRDSAGYLQTAAHLVPSKDRPAGYPLFLRLLPIEGDLWVAPLVQHLLGVATAVILYVLLRRLGVRNWVAAAATAPLLYDALLLNLEHHVLTEALFVFLTVLGIAAVLWRPTPSVASAGMAGLLCAAGVLTRAGGLLIIVPLAAAVLFLRGGVRPIAAMAAAFLLPLVLYANWFHSYHGTYGAVASGRYLYGRTATIVDCARITLPAPERQLCPAEPLAARRPRDFYIWSRESPLRAVTLPPGISHTELVSSFSREVIREQPVDFLRAVAVDFFRGFAPVRGSLPLEPSIDKWRFTRDYPTRSYAFDPVQAQEHSAAREDAMRAYGSIGGSADSRLTGILVAYQRVAATPGLLLLAALGAGALTAAGVGRARASGLRVAAMLFCGVSACYLAPAAVQGFSWRYVAVPIVLLPCAAAVAFTALTRRPDPVAVDEPRADAKPSRG